MMIQLSDCSGNGDIIDSVVIIVQIWCMVQATLQHPQLFDSDNYKSLI